MEPIFIVGCPRSGTTLLRNLLRSHPSLAFPEESNFIPDLYRAYGDPRSDEEAVSLAKRILGTRWVRQWRLDLSPNDFAGCRRFRDLVSMLFVAWARKRGKTRWGDKTVAYLREIPTLLELFPEAKIIHIYRDGRDVALSWLRLGAEPMNLYTAARLWGWRVKEAMRVGRQLTSGRYHEVRYEHLIENVRETMADVCAFIGEPFVEDVLVPEASRQLPPGARSRHVSTTEVVAGNREKWRTRMSTAERILFESVAGDFLAALGYPTEGQRRPVPGWERAFWRAHHEVAFFAARVRASLNPEFAMTAMSMRLAGLRKLIGS